MAICVYAVEKQIANVVQMGVVGGCESNFITNTGLI